MLVINSPTTLRLFGTGITNDTLIAFTRVAQERYSLCDQRESTYFAVSFSFLNN